MITILVIDDNPEKLKVVRNLLDLNKSIKSYDVAQDTVQARRFLQTNFYDLVILDLNVPIRFGDEPSPTNSINLLREINQSVRLITPSHIIGLTIHDDLMPKYRLDFEELMWLIILYEHNSDNWAHQLNIKIEYLIKSKVTLLNSSSNHHQYDVAFITAIRDPELNAVLNLPLDWKSFKIENDATEYFNANIIENNKNISFVAASCLQMGMTAAAVLSMKMIHSFRPKYIIMTGIAAGIEGKCEYGDILVSELSFDYSCGKITIDLNNEKKFQPDYKTIELSRDLLEDIQSCKAKRLFVDEIKDKWQGDKPKTSIEVHVGPLASGGSVVEDTSSISEIKNHARKLIGIDMETYGVFYAANNCSKPKPLGAMSIKSVSDFANPNKSDGYQKYASYTSASFAYKFLIEKIFR
jgi:nucleoside phosphorylase/CheY-like chemotaxis protein